MKEKYIFITVAFILFLWTLFCIDQCKKDQKSTWEIYDNITKEFKKSEQFQIVSKYPIWRTENDETDSSTTIFIKTSKYSNCEFKTCEKVIIPDTIYFCIKTSR